MKMDNRYYKAYCNDFQQAFNMLKVSNQIPEELYESLTDSLAEIERFFKSQPDTIEI